MKPTRLFFTAAALLASLLFSPLSLRASETAAPAVAAPAPTFPKAAATPTSAEKPAFYLTGNEPTFAKIPPAPKLNSEADRADLLIVLTVQNSRTDRQIKDAKRNQVYAEALLGLNHAVDPAFETSHPETSAVGRLIAQTTHDGDLILNHLKQKYQRPRPYVQHPGLVLPLFTANHASYPSGHATGAVLRAELLAELFPEHAEELRAKAQLIAASRVVAGVHYESDIEAGQELGALIYHQLKASPKFHQDFEAAKAELAGAAAK